MSEEKKKPLVSFEPSTELSEKEKENIDSAFVDITAAMTALSEELKELPRDEAFKRMGILVRVVNSLPGQLSGKVMREPRSEPRPVARVINNLSEDEVEPVIDSKRFPHVSTEKPNLMDIVAQLKTERVGLDGKTVLNDQKRAAKYLDCVAKYEELGADIVCPECNPELMLSCINTNDPTIHVPQGQVSRQS